MNHTEKCRSRFQEIFIKSGDPRLRKAERMGYGETEKTDPHGLPWKSLKKKPGMKR